MGVRLGIGVGATKAYMRMNFENEFKYFLYKLLCKGTRNAVRFAQAVRLKSESWVGSDD